MSKYGNKFTCWSCGTKFYDMNKPEPTCPKCGSDPSQDPNLGKVEASEDFGNYEDDFDGDLDDANPNEDEDEDEDGDGDGDFGAESSGDEDEDF